MGVQARSLRGGTATPRKPRSQTTATRAGESATRRAELRWVSAPLQPRSRQTLERLVEAGAELLEEKPFAAITVREIVGRAESSVGSFYARFKDKEAFFSFLHERYQALVVDGVSSLLDATRARGRSARDIVTEVVPVFVTVHSERRGLLQAFHARAAVDEAYRAREVALNEHIARAFLAVLPRADVRAADPQRAVDLAVSMLLGILLQRALFGAPHLTPLDDTELGQELTGLFMLHLERGARPKKGTRR